MAGVRAITPTLLSAISTSFNDIFNRAYNETEVDYEKVAMTVNSASAIEIYAWLEQFPGVREWIGDRVIHDLKTNGYQLTNQLWESTVSLKRTDIEDDIVGVYNARVTMMGYNAKVFRDFKIFQLMTAGNATACYDGQNFYSASHTWKGNTVSNLTNTALTAENFNTVLAALMSNLGAPGTQNEAPLIVRPQFQLVCGPALRASANEILRAEYNNFGANNINYNAAELLVTPIITGSQWFLNVTNSPIKPFIFQPRTAIEVIDQIAPDLSNVFMKDEYNYGTRERFTVGYALWQLSYGSFPS